MSTKYDTTQPILIIARKAPRGTGYLIAPFDNPQEICPCPTPSDLGEIIIDMIDDEKQPRADLGSFSKNNEKQEAEEEIDDEEAEDEEEEEEGGGDLADQLIWGLASKLISAGQNVSTGGHKRSKRKTKK